ILWVCNGRSEIALRRTAEIVIGLVLAFAERIALVADDARSQIVGPLATRAGFCGDALIGNAYRAEIVAICLLIRAEFGRALGDTGEFQETFYFMHGLACRDAVHGVRRRFDHDETRTLPAPVATHRRDLRTLRRCQAAATGTNKNLQSAVAISEPDRM